MSDSTIIYRAASLTNKDAVNVKDRTVTFSFSSPTPVRRYYGNEILSMDPAAMRQERFQSGQVPFLLNHKTDDQIGTIVNHFQRGQKWYATAKISRSQRGEDYLQDAADSLRPGISFGYRTHKLTRIRKADPQVPGDVDDYRVDDFEPLEVSAVSVAADPRVGIGRADDAPFDLCGVDITDEDGKPIVLARSEATAAAKSPKEQIREEAQQQAYFEVCCLRDSGFTIAQLHCIDQFLKLSPVVRSAF